MRALLDVNVLIPLLDGAHVHHSRASAWLERNLAGGWASFPITQYGCIRIMSQPAYPTPGRRQPLPNAWQKRQRSPGTSSGWTTSACSTRGWSTGRPSSGRDR